MYASESGGGGGGFSQHATGRFYTDMLKEARRRIPTGADSGDVVSRLGSSTQRNGGAGSQEKRITMNMRACQANYEFVRRNPLLMLAVTRVFDDIVSGGVMYEVRDGTQQLEQLLSDKQRAMINQQITDTTRSTYMQWVANGFAVLQTIKSTDDPDTSLVVALEPNEYMLSWTKKTGRTRDYELKDDDGGTKLNNAVLAMHSAPSNDGTPQGQLLAMRELLDIGTSLLREYHHGFYWGAHPVPTTEASASAGRADRNEVMAAPHFVDGDNQQYVEERRERVMNIHAAEQEAAMGDLMDANDAIAVETLSMLASVTGMVNSYNPTLNAIRNPPYRTVLRLGLDRRLSTHVPMPELDSRMVEVETYVNSLVMGLIGAPPALRTDVVEKSATESSLLWTYYSNAIHGLQQRLSQFLSLALRKMTFKMFKDMFNQDFDRQTPPKDNEALEVARVAQRSVNISERMERLLVNVRFVHVPKIAPEGIQTLYAQDIIAEDTAAKYMAAYYGVPMADVLSPAERERQRKRRQADEARQAEVLATANAVGKRRADEAGLPPTKRMGGGSDK